jgi:hypothetical protein
MTPAETIQAAIEKLARLRDGADADFFAIDDVGTESYLGYLRVAQSVDPSTITPEDADLIATLHATVDAQLALLAETHRQYAAWGNRVGRHTVDPDGLVLNLANAILGEQAHA